MTHIQFFKYVAIGLGTILALFGLYLALTGLGIRYLVAMTMVYVLGVVIGFVLNRGWTFSYQGQSTACIHALPGRLYSRVISSIYPCCIYLWLK